jgi:hypothetical protein
MLCPAALSGYYHVASTQHPHGTCVLSFLSRSTTQSTQTDLTLLHVNPLIPPLTHPVPASLLLLHRLSVCGVFVLLQVTALTSQLSGIRVMCVDYRLAPLHPFPAGLSDALGVYRALTTEQGYKPSSIGLIGDSAGECVDRGGGQQKWAVMVV